MTAPPLATAAARRAAWRDLPPAAFDVFAWAVAVGAVLTHNDGGGLDLAPAPCYEVAPEGPVQRAFVWIPPKVETAFAASWPAVLAALDATHAALERRGFTGSPDVPAPLLTVCTWADVLRATFDPRELRAWARAARAYGRAGRPRWLAVEQAVEDVRAASPSLRAYESDSRGALGFRGADMPGATWRADSHRAPAVLVLTTTFVVVPAGAAGETASTAENSGEVPGVRHARAGAAASTVQRP